VLLAVEGLGLTAARSRKTRLDARRGRVVRSRDSQVRACRMRAKRLFFFLSSSRVHKPAFGGGALACVVVPCVELCSAVQAGGQRVRCDASSEQSCGTCRREYGVVKDTRDVLRGGEYPKRENEAQGEKDEVEMKWGGLSGKSVWAPLFFFSSCASSLMFWGELPGPWLMRGWRAEGGLSGPQVARAAVRCACLGGDSLDRDVGKIRGS